MKYIIYAEGTMSNDGRERALYQRRGSSPIYTTGAYADRFDEDEAERITRYKGKYVWVKRAVNDVSIDDDKHSQLSELAKQYKELYLGKSKTKPHPKNPDPGPKRPLSEMTESINAALNAAFSDEGYGERALIRLKFAIEQSEENRRNGRLSKFGIKNLARGKKIFAVLQNDIKNHTLPNTPEKMKERLMQLGRYEMLTSKPTGRQVEALLNRGYTREQIRNMTKEQAHNVIMNKPRKSSVVDYDAKTQEAKLTSYSLEFRKRLNQHPEQKREILFEAKAAFDNVVEDTDAADKADIKQRAAKHWSDLQRFAEALKYSTKDSLVQSSSEKAFNKNIATEIKSGKDPKQAVAIAYSVKNANDATTVADMALSRTDAMDRAISLGKQFIAHFDKICKNPEDISVNHWKSEMRTWFESVKSIKLKSNHKPLLDSEIHDWFLTAGAEAQDFMQNPTPKEIDHYDKFATQVLANGINAALNNNEHFNIHDNRSVKKNDMKMKDGKELQNFRTILSYYSKMYSNDPDISLILDALNHNGYPTKVEKVEGWLANRNVPGEYIKKYTLISEVEGKQHRVLATLYADEHNWKVKEINAYMLDSVKENDSMNVVDGININVKLNGKNYKGVFNGISGADKKFGDVYVPELVDLRSGVKGVYNPDEGNYVADGKFYFKMTNLLEWNPGLRSYFKDSMQDSDTYQVWTISENGQYHKEAEVTNPTAAKAIAQKLKQFGKWVQISKNNKTNILNDSARKNNNMIKDGIGLANLRALINTGEVDTSRVNTTGEVIIRFKNDADKKDAMRKLYQHRVPIDSEKGLVLYIDAERILSTVNDSMIKDDAKYFQVDMTNRWGGTVSLIVKANSFDEAKSKAQKAHPEWAFKAGYVSSEGHVLSAKQRGMYVDSVKDASSLKVIAKRAMTTSDGCSRHYLEVEDCDGKRFYMITDDYDGKSKQFNGAGTIIEDKATLNKRYKDDLAQGLASTSRSALSGVKTLKQSVSKLGHDSASRYSEDMMNMYRGPLKSLIDNNTITSGVSASKVDAMLGINNVALTKQLLKDAGVEYSPIEGKTSEFTLSDIKDATVNKSELIDAIKRMLSAANDENYQAVANMCYNIMDSLKRLGAAK